jgi:hypothetical protein
MPLLSRREFVWSVIAAAPALVFGRLSRPSCDHTPASRGPHPTPRPGIDASRVLKAEELGNSRRAIVAFDQVRQIPQIADGIRCHCGCASHEGFYSLLSCYEGDAMARSCDVCQGQGRMAFRLHRAGKSLDDIRAAIDARYE